MNMSESNAKRIRTCVHGGHPGLTRAPSVTLLPVAASGPAGLQATQNAPTNKAIGPGPERNDLANLPDDAFALVLTAIDEPRAAARMLSAYRRTRAAVPVPAPSELGPLTPVLIQVQATSACLASSRTQDRHPCPGLMMAATHGWVQLLPRLVEHGEKWIDETSRQAVRSNHLEVFQWGLLHIPSLNWGSRCDDAAQCGHLDLLRLLRAQSPPAPWGWATWFYAASGGYLELLKWARAQSPPAPWDVYTCTAAAEGGHLELLRWARDQTPPAPWDEFTCTAAAGGGHLELLQWARAQTPPVPWDATTCARAAARGHLAVVQWARAQIPPAP